MNEGSYEVWNDFLKNRRHSKINSEVSTNLVQNSLKKNDPKEREKEFAKLYVKLLKDGVDKLKISKSDLKKILDYGTLEQKRKILELLEKGKDRK